LGGGAGDVRGEQKGAFFKEKKKKEWGGLGTMERGIGYGFENSGPWGTCKKASLFPKNLGRGGGGVLGKRAGLINNEKRLPHLSNEVASNGQNRNKSRNLWIRGHTTKSD